jgi:hypothetical protein
MAEDWRVISLSSAALPRIVVIFQFCAWPGVIAHALFRGLVV